MKKEKIIGAVIIVLFALILIFIEPTYTGYGVSKFKTNLTVNSYGPGQQLEGVVDVSFTDLPADTKIIATLSNIKSELELKNICAECDIVPASYNLKQEVSQSIVNFDKAGFNDSYGVVFRTTMQTPTLVIIANFNVGGEAVNGVNPKLPSINIGRKANWSYVGPLIANQFEDIPINYLFDYNADDQSNIGGAETDEYCEKIKFTPSSYYKIETHIKKAIDGANLKARLRNLDYSIALNTMGQEAVCVIAADSTFGWRSCLINITNKVDKDYYACIYASGGSVDVTYYKISVENPNAIFEGVYCGGGTCISKGGVDYFIRVARNKFVTNLSTTEKINLKEDLSGLSCTAQVNKDGLTYCLYPIRISSEGEGKITLSIPPGELQVRAPDIIDGKLYLIDSVPAMIRKEDLKINLIDFPDLLTTSTEGIHKLRLELKYNNNVYSSDESDINVFNLPTASITANPIGYVYQNIEFKANVNGNKTEIISYEWDFGDAIKETTLDPNVTHSYDTLGDYVVKLVAVDSNNAKSQGTNFTIKIGSVQKNVDFLVNDTKVNIARFSSQISSVTDENVLDVINLLNLNANINNATSSLSQYELEYASALGLPDADKEVSLSTLQSNLLGLRDNVPRSLNVSGFSFPSALDFISDIPDEVAGGKPKEAILEFQSNVNVVSKGYLVNLDYISGRGDKFRLIKKDVSASNAENAFVIEVIPKEVASSIEGDKILTGDYEIVSADPIIKWPITNNLQIVYIIESGNLDNLIKTKTFVIPEELAVVEEGICPNKVCEVPLEDEISCPEDCKRKIPLGIYIPLLLALIVGIYYINFYKGPGNFKDLTNWISVKLIKKRVFTSKVDLANLVSYIRQTTRQGISETQVREILSKKGWAKEQIDYAFKEAKK